MEKGSLKKDRIINSKNKAYSLNYSSFKFTITSFYKLNKITNLHTNNCVYNIIKSIIFIYYNYLLLRQISYTWLGQTSRPLNIKRDHNKNVEKRGVF